MSIEPAPTSPANARKKAAAERSLEFIKDGQTIGLGTGSTVQYLLEALAGRVKDGLRIQGVPTSRRTAILATQLHIPVLADEDGWEIDVAIDGADEIDSQWNLVKGGGGALLREKIVAANAKKFIVIVDSAKQVSSLGLLFPVPVEVEPFGWPSTARKVEQLGCQTTLRRKEGAIFVTDNQNYILDVKCGGLANPSEFEQRLNRIPGVVENGLFIGMTSVLVVGADDGVKVLDHSST